MAITKDQIVTVLKANAGRIGAGVVALLIALAGLYFT